MLVGDSGEFQFTGAILGIPHPTGYPLYTLLNWLWSHVPLGTVAYRINLSSAVYMAAAVAILAALIWRLLGDLEPPDAPPEAPAAHVAARAGVALGAALLFGVSGTVWAQALVARAYALNALLVAACLAALYLWWSRGRMVAFLAAVLCIGLALAHHGTTVTLLPGYAVWLLAAEWRHRATPWPARVRRWAVGVGVFLLGLSPYLLFIIRFVFGYTYYWGNPRTWADVWALARGAPFAGQIFAYPLTWDGQVARLGFGFDQISQQYGGIGLVLGLLGLARLLVDRRARPAGAALTLLWLANFVFASNYAIIGALYLIPTYFFWAIFLAAALHWPLTLIARLPAPAVRRAALGAALAVFALGAVVLPGQLALARFAAQDRSGDTQARDLALTTLAQAAANARVYVDWEAICVFRYYQYVDHRRTDLDLQSGDPNDWARDIGADLAAGRAVYVGGFAGPDPPAPVTQAFRLARVGLVYQVLGRSAAAAP